MTQTAKPPKFRGPDQHDWYYCEGECPLCKSKDRVDDGTMDWDDGDSKHFVCNDCGCHYHEFFRGDDHSYANTTVDVAPATKSNP